MTILNKKDLLCGQCTSSLEFCEYYVFGKQKRLSFSMAIHRIKGTLDYIHSYLWGPSCEPLKGNGSRYLLTFIDNFSRKISVYFLKEKVRLLRCLKSGRLFLRTKLERRLKG
jgi:hypothetical protein